VVLYKKPQKKLFVFYSETLSTTVESTITVSATTVESTITVSATLESCDTVVELLQELKTRADTAIKKNFFIIKLI
jgi:hypothetical protein